MSLREKLGSRILVELSTALEKDVEGSITLLAQYIQTSSAREKLALVRALSDADATAVGKVVVNILSDGLKSQALAEADALIANGTITVTRLDKLL